MDTEPVEPIVASDPSVSAQIISFALLGAGEPHSARPFPNMPAVLARLMLSAIRFPRVLTYLRPPMDGPAPCSACETKGTDHLPDYVDQELIDEMRDAIQTRSVISSDRFNAEIEATLKRKVELGKRGRPVKDRDDQRMGEPMSLLAEHQ